MQNWKYALLAATSVLILAGCDSNPTNEPSPVAVEQANVKRAAAIDADPSMTAADKKKMKEMLHLDGVKASKDEKH